MQHGKNKQCLFMEHFGRQWVGRQAVGDAAGRRGFKILKAVKITRGEGQGAPTDWGGMVPPP